MQHQVEVSNPKLSFSAFSEGKDNDLCIKAYEMAKELGVYVMEDAENGVIEGVTIGEKTFFR